VSISELAFMLSKLLQHVIQGRLNGRSWVGCRFLNRHLTGWKPQIQGNDRTFAVGIVFQAAFEMDQFGAEHLQSILQFFDKVSDFAFNFGGFRNFVADMNIHSLASKTGSGSREAFCYSSILHLLRK